MLLRILLLLIITSQLLAAGSKSAKTGKTLPLDGVFNVQMKSRESSFYLHNRLIVKLMPRQTGSLSKSSFGIPSLDRALSKVGVTSVQPMFPHVFGSSGETSSNVDLSLIYAVTFSTPHDAFSLAEELSQYPEVLYAEPWFIYPLTRSGLFTPNDPLFSQQWGLKKINAEAAWDVTQGDSSVVVAIVDSGTEWAHPDLSANIWTNPGESGLDAQGRDKRSNGVDDDNNGYVDDWHGWDFVGADYEVQVFQGDNNPTSTGPNNDHGTHVAGIAAATTNNGTGIASIGFRTKILPVKCAADNDRRSGGLAFILTGYQGIAYAAMMGAHVINCSWGGAGGSQFEQDIIDFATGRGSLVVAAAGNNGNNIFFSPAGYRGVLSVAATDQNDVKASFSNYGYDVDVSAPGVAILSTLYPSRYNTGTELDAWSGTSMASPFVAGLAALVKARFPQLTGLQIGERVRVTSDNIDQQNFNYPNQLGKGRINALRGVTETASPSVRLLSFRVSDSPGGNGNGFAQPAETLNIVCSFRNYLTPTSASATVELISLSQYLTVIWGSYPVGALRTMDSTANASTPFRVYVQPHVPASHVAYLQTRIRDGSYADVHTFSFLVNPTYQTHDINRIQLTLTNNGKIGFFDYPTNAQGVGLVFNETNHLFEGGLIIGVSGSRIVDVVRNESGGQNNDFSSNGFYTITTPGVVSQQDGYTKFTDATAFGTERVGVEVEMHSYAFSTPGDDSYIILRYDIKNTTSTVLQNLYAGIFLDWDIGNYNQNISAYDAARSLAYSYDASGTRTEYMGAQALDGAASFRSLLNTNSIDLSRFAKWNWISGGIVAQRAGPFDVHQVISSGPYTIAAGATQTVGFTLAAADSFLTRLQTVADAAKRKWDAIRNPVSVEPIASSLPSEFRLYQNYPNPFNPRTVIEFEIPKASRVRLAVHDLLGRVVKELVDHPLTPGSYKVEWNAENLPSSIYLARLTMEGLVETRKMVLAK
jgi:subtilisin family serine protease